MLKNTISNQWLKTIDQAEATIELIVFAIGEVSFGIPITKLTRISAPLENQDFQLEPDLEILDLHHRLFGTSITNPTAMVIFRGDKLLGISIDTTPTSILVPLDRIRIIPDEFRSNNPLGIASHIAIVSTPTAELTIFILGT